MSAFTALWRAREYMSRHGVAFAEARRALVDTNADNVELDFEAASELRAFVTPTQSRTDIEMARRIISAVLLANAPPVVALAQGGRSSLASALRPNIVQLMLFAGLLDDPPDAACVAWWDTLANLARGAQDAARTESGREGERLSLERERDQLRRLGIALEPRWVGFEDNSAGYDILSFDLGPVGPTARMVEVKAYHGPDVRFFLTRSEWDTARMSLCYEFHIWRLPQRHLIQLTVDEVSAHVPVDCGAGRWQEVLIVL